MNVSGPSTDTIRSLSELEYPEACLISLYIDLDPSRFATPPARSTQVTSLLNELSALEQEGELSHEARMSVRADRERLERFLGDFDAGQAHGVAIFCSEEAGLWEVLKLPEAPEPQVHLGQHLHLQPLIGQEHDEDWLVLLASRSEARLLRGDVRALREVRHLSADVPNQHQKGGWSQARYERGVEEAVDDHLDDATAFLFRLWKRRPFDHLIVAANDHFRPRVREQLHPYLQERIRAEVDIDEQLAGPEEVLEAIRPAIESYERERREEVLSRLEAEGAREGKAAFGLDDALDALIQRRVEVLVYRDGVRARGAECPSCGYLAAGDVNACPSDGTRLEQRDDLMDVAAARALQQDAKVLILGLQEAPGIEVAALLRF